MQWRNFELVDMLLLTMRNCLAMNSSNDSIIVNMSQLGLCMYLCGLVIILS